MRGDSIVIEDHHRKAAAEIAPVILKALTNGKARIGVTIAGESGSGKSEVAAALAEALNEQGIASVIFGQDDYFVYPPKSNDAERRKDIAWVGPQEVKLDLLDEHMRAFISGIEHLEKPEVVYEEDRIDSTTLATNGARVAIAEGTYTTLIPSATHHAFINLNYSQTRKHREKRNRDASELDVFIDSVLEIEHGIISAHKDKADIIINGDYSVTLKP